MNNNRDTGFIPLSSAAVPPKPNAEVKLTVLPQASNVQPFRPLGHSAPTVSSATPHSGTCEPRVSIQRDGDRVSTIQVQCSCGQVIELACVY